MKWVRSWLLVLTAPRPSMWMVCWKF